jgi:hypothetical protein
MELTTAVLAHDSAKSDVNLVTGDMLAVGAQAKKRRHHNLI